MNNIIHKFELGYVDAGVFLRVDLPQNWAILKVGFQISQLCVWVARDSNLSITEEKTFRVFGTGIPTNVDLDSLTYLDTIFQVPYVWHVFMEK